MAGVHVFLETERLVLRRFTLDDQRLLYELDNDPAVMRYINNGQPVEQTDVADMLEHWLAYYERFEGYGYWAAIDKAAVTSATEFLGWFHFRPGVGAGPLEPELGYRLHTAAWGQGLATEGSQALVDLGFEQLGAERAGAETMLVNAASWRVMEKVGMRLVRTFRSDWPVRIPGDEFGDVEYGITREEWSALRRRSSDTA